MVRRPGKVIEIGNHGSEHFVKLYATVMKDRIEDEKLRDIIVGFVSQIPS